MKIESMSLKAFLLVSTLMIVSSCGGSGGTSSGFDSQELNDNSAQIQTNANNAELVFVGTITAIGTAPGFWSGIAMSSQAVTYTVDSVLKGNSTETSLTVNMLVVEGGRQSSESAGLTDTLFAVGNQQIVFAEQNAGYVSLGTDYEGPQYIDVESNFGTIPYSAQNQTEIESMIANPTVAQVGASVGSDSEKGSSFEKTLTITGSEADMTSWNSMLDECKEMSQTLSDLVSAIQNSETYTVTMTLVRSEDRVFVDSWTSKKVDVKDLEDWDLNGCNAKTSRCQLFAHILQEYWHAAVTGDDYEPSHASALQHENQVRADLGKTTTLTGHFGVSQGGNVYCQTTYGTSTELVQIVDGANMGPVTVQNTPPAAPSGLVADGSTSCQITITWTDNATDEEGYIVERKQGDAGAWMVEETLDANATTWTNAQAVQGDLVLGETFCYRVRAYTTVDGEFVYSSYSNESCAVKQ
jgi:hypothetical protein